ncbi:hypothetical protein ACZ91_44275 [Streptomyces regensis]|nr:hypothetical protein ACZ91_44275 [Streptomyces regensis]
MTLHAASRDALGFAETRLDEVLGDAGTNPSAVGEELLSVVDLLTREVGLRRSVGDGSSDPEARKRLVRSLLQGKVSEPALGVLDTVVGSRWSSPRELLDGLETVARKALLVSADKAGKLEVEQAAAYRSRSVAYVRSATELTGGQRDQLSARLEQIYGRPMALHVQLDQSVGAGLVIRVGDEVIDGSVAGRIEALRRQLAS